MYNISSERLSENSFAPILIILLLIGRVQIFYRIMIPPQVIKQVIVLAGMTCCSISEGYILGHMAGMVSGLRSEDSDITVSEGDIELIASTINITAVIGFLVAGILTEKFGRRFIIAILSAPNVLNWIVVYYARSVAVLLATRVIVGVCFGGVLMLSAISTAEYMPPNHRGACLSLIICVGSSLGVMLAHILGILLHWRTAALIGIIPSAISVLMPLLLVESPQWLASKGKYDECEKSFKALHSHRDTCDDELRMLIEVEKRKQSEITKTTHLIQMTKVRSAMKKKFFWVLMFLNIINTTYTIATGYIPFQTYAITMLQEITGVSDILWFTVIVDGLALVGACISCFMLGMMKMRTLLFTGALGANVLLGILSATLYVSSESFLLQWVNCILLGLYFVMIHAGPLPVLTAYVAETPPIEIKGVFFLVGGFICGVASFTTVMITPNLIKALNYSGTFILNIIIMSICLLLFWKYLPETKGKSLQEIERYFKSIGDTKQDPASVPLNALSNV